jgi:zinc protease
MTAAELGPLLDKIFGPLPAQAQGQPVTPLQLQHQGKTYVYAKAMPQTMVMMLAPAPARAAPDWVATNVMNQIFGAGGFGSRLMEVIREKEGLTYGIYASINSMDALSTLGISASTRNDQTARLVALIQGEITKMRDKGVTQQELDDARSYILGSMPADLTSTDRISGLLLGQMLDNRPLDDFDTYRTKLRTLTVSDINKAAATWLHPNRFVTVLVGQPKDITDAYPLDRLPNVE